MDAKIRVVTKEKKIAAEVGFSTYETCIEAYFRIRNNVLQAQLSHNLFADYDGDVGQLRVHYPVPPRTVETEKVLMLSNTDKETRVQNGLLQVIINDDGIDRNHPSDVVDLSIWTDGMGAHCLAFATLHSRTLFDNGKSNAHFVAGYLGGEKVMKANSGTLWQQIGPLHDSFFTNPSGEEKLTIYDSDIFCTIMQ